MNVNKPIFLFTSLFIMTLLSCNLTSSYNLNFPAPADSSWPEDIYPQQINGIPASPSTLDFGGTEVKYGNDKSIYIARMQDEKEAIQFFKKNILPDFENLSSNYSGNVKGQFFAEASGKGKKFFGWVNKRYIFVLKADSEKAFDELIQNFPLISKK